MAQEVFSDMSERLDYNNPGFPVYARCWERRPFDRYLVPCHWHNDLEFVLVLDGEMDYFVNGQSLHIANGEGIFVNSRRLHYIFSENKSSCSFICVVVHPDALGFNTPLGKTFFENKFSFETDDCILLNPKSQWQKEVLQTTKLIFDETEKNKDNPLSLLSLVSSLCACTADNIKPLQENNGKKINANSSAAIMKMTGFIFQNFTEKIKLDDIAASGSVCRSKCCQLFGEYVGQTPNAYLTSYRLRKSCEMLKGSNMSVMEVAMACGFQSPSYFTHIFKKEIGLTPKEYRKQSNVSVLASP